MIFNKKVKQNKGSALVLVILALALTSMSILTISRQVNNQIKLNGRSYEDMNYKYLAEAGIEKSISEINSDIMSSANSKRNKSSHGECPKVEYDNNNFPIAGSNFIPGDTFNYLIWKEIIDDRIGATHQHPLYESLKDFFVNDTTLWTYYVNNIWQVAGYIFAGQTWHIDLFKENLDEFILLIEETKEKALSTPGNEDKKKKLIQELDEMKENIVEIKCRLGMDIGTTTEVKISLPEYTCFINTSEQIEETDEFKNKEIVIVKDNDNLKISKVILNNTEEIIVTNNTIDIVAHSSKDRNLDKELTIKAKVKFILDDLNDIKYEIISYEQQRN